VGTNTLRRAKNADDFLQEAEEVLGHPIETISGREEARLIYLGVAHSVANPPGRRLVLDIGGGSTELIVGRDFRPLELESLYLGCVTMSRTYFPGGEIDASRWKRAETAAMQELGPLRRRFRRLGWDQAVGASGTVRSIDAVCRAEGWSDDGITSKSLKRLRDALLRAGHVDRLRLKGLNPERRAVFPGGVAVMAAAFEALGISSMESANGALREGLLYDLLGRSGKEDVRIRSVNALAERFHVDRGQAARVEETARRYLRRLSRPWELTSKDTARLLSWAAQLHEIGLDIAHQQFHKHGAYIVAESDLFGFSREDQRVLATLVRAHRRKFPSGAVKALPRRWRRPAERLAVLLRLAVVLHRSRSSDPLPRLQLGPGKRSLKVRIPSGWMDAHPLTVADLDQERAYLEEAGFRLDLS
jgi:exopolyphosphatase/guanosine-5'-triphosphate,3'-diphosphate pyrophosphatase